jgi:ATP-dependent RNA helicase HelY
VSTDARLSDPGSPGGGSEKGTDLSPADRYARAQHRRQFADLHEFASQLPFQLDPFQREACEALEAGRGVLVCAPTGAGKTIVGEFAVFRALAHGGKCFYTTPIKALSNQKYADLVTRHGASVVGLLTGDTAVNPHAPIVVMTTEVLRNMLYAGSPDLAGLTSVVMDEIHYLADKFRGAVWEEVILHTDPAVQLVGLSATVSNAEEFGAWLQEVRGHTTVVVDEHRPVPLWQHMMVGRRTYDLFSAAGPSGAPGGDAPGAQARIDPALARAAADAESRFARYTPERSRGPRDHRAPSFRPPSRADIIDRLDSQGLLPAITFIFSRAGCDAAVQQCLRAGLRLTSEQQRAEIHRIVDRRTADLPEADLAVLGYWEWREGLERGIAAHHAGLLPAFKETVEELFVAGLVKAVFATETLALGINMPARTVVLERLVKFNGEGHADLTPGEYTQLTGRAGRRGIDVEGHAVVLWAPGVDPRAVAGLASRRLYPLRSSFRPSYNMAVNLLDRMSPKQARELLEQSFAQYQANAAVVGIARQVRRAEQAIDAQTELLHCHLGDAVEYAELVNDLARKEKEAVRGSAARRHSQTHDALARLKRGDIVAVPGGRRAGLAVVLDPGVSSDGSARPLVITEQRWSGRLSAADFRGDVPSLGRLKLPKHVEHSSPHVRRQIASALLAQGISTGRPSRTRDRGDDEEIALLRAAVRTHPVHGCADRDAHLQVARRRAGLQHELRALTERVSGARDSLGRAFDRISVLLQRRGFLEGAALTSDGRLLARIWSESDLVVAECVRAGVWDDLGPADLAGAVSVLVFEARQDAVAPGRTGSRAAAIAIEESAKVWAAVVADERAFALPETREPDAGFAAAVAAWADGATLTQVLDIAAGSGIELSAGDFVRWCRQVIDLLDQLGSVLRGDDGPRTRAQRGPEAGGAEQLTMGRDAPGVGRTAAEAVNLLRRGVVALGSS